MKYLLTLILMISFNLSSSAQELDKVQSRAFALHIANICIESSAKIKGDCVDLECYKKILLAQMYEQYEKSMSKYQNMQKGSFGEEADSCIEMVMSHKFKLDHFKKVISIRLALLKAIGSDEHLKDANVYIDSIQKK